MRGRNLGPPRAQHECGRSCRQVRAYQGHSLDTYTFWCPDCEMEFTEAEFLNKGSPLAEVSGRKRSS